MNYDPQKTCAVFLGPSLVRSHAIQRLAANYYPPVRMGDIYRLLGSGVRRIVIIDGLFHGPASVWQREILEALQQGIQVVGAASMGALRAAELYPFGMVGHGTIFEWYRTGLIDGDDEVALLHGDEATGFQAFSEPLVNLRYNLQRAAKQDIISLPQMEELIEHVKSLYYADRTYRALFACPVVASWSDATQNRLQQFIQHQALNLKRQDAIDALNNCASTMETEKPVTAPLWSFPEPNPYYQLTRYQHRGFLQSTGKLVSGKELLDALAKDAKLYTEYRPVLVKNFFLLQWAKQRAFQCPMAFYETYRKQWQDEQVNTTEQAWLRANGLTKQECYTELAQRALIRWLIEQDPSHFGLTLTHYGQFAAALLPKSASKPAEAENKVRALLVAAVESCYLATWARENGIACPVALVERYMETLEATLDVNDRNQWLHAIGLDEQCYCAVMVEQALCRWLIDRGPAYFGYISWSLEIALLKELQITGRVAQLVATIG